MHEMSIAQSLLELAQEEALRQGCDKILSLKVQYGGLAGLMPEALDFCFRSLVAGTKHEGAELLLERLPLRLRCPACNAVFDGDGQDALWRPCPACGGEPGYIVEQGRELLLASLTACQS